MEADRRRECADAPSRDECRTVGAPLLFFLRIIVRWSESGLYDSTEYLVRRDGFHVSIQPEFVKCTFQNFRI